jgi:hypothetical protein
VEPDADSCIEDLFPKCPAFFCYPLMLHNFIKTRAVKEQDKMMNSSVLTLKAVFCLTKQQDRNFNVQEVLNNRE